MGFNTFHAIGSGGGGRCGGGDGRCGGGVIDSDIDGHQVTWDVPATPPETE